MTLRMMCIVRGTAHKLWLYALLTATTFANCVFQLLDSQIFRIHGINNRLC